MHIDVTLTPEIRAARLPDECTYCVRKLSAKAVEERRGTTGGAKRGPFRGKFGRKEDPGEEAERDQYFNGHSDLEALESLQKSGQMNGVCRAGTCLRTAVDFGTLRSEGSRHHSEPNKVIASRNAGEQRYGGQEDYKSATASVAQQRAPSPLPEGQ
jgi:hypothetical protein